MFACIHVRGCECMYVCMYVSMHACMHPGPGPSPGPKSVRFIVPGMSFRVRVRVMGLVLGPGALRPLEGGPDLKNMGSGPRGRAHGGIEWPGFQP